MKDEDSDQVGTDLNDSPRDDLPAPQRSRGQERWSPAFGRGKPKQTTWWHETCRPEFPPRLNLLSLGVGFMAGFVVAVLVWPHLNPVPKDAPAVPASQSRIQSPNTSGPRSAAVLLGQMAGPVEVGGIPLSEKDENNLAQWQAAAWRLQTETLLARTDIVMIWHLDEWRRLLARHQDAIVEVARLATGGGTWASHELLRNDLALERDLLAHHAATLGADPEQAAEVDLQGRQRRAERWAVFWQEIEAAADARIRASSELDEAWKEQLDPALAELHVVHEELLALLLELPDGQVADAVSKFCSDYFRKTFPRDTQDPGGTD